MGLFRTRDVDQQALDRILPALQRVGFARSQPAVLRAAGLRIERMSAERLRAVAGNKQSWQTLAWSYRDMIPELRYAQQFRARAIARVQFLVAEIVSDDDEPIPVSLRTDEDPGRAERVTLPDDLCAAAEQELDRLPLASYGFTGVWSENFDVAGECWLYGHEHPDTGEETWEIRSVLDVDVQGTSITIKDALGQPRAVNLNEDSNEELYRLWVPHPARPHLGDSALNAAMDVMEEITLIGREIRAVSRSRIASNGYLFLPDGMAQMKNTREDTDNSEDRREQFLADLEAATLAPIANEGDAGAVAPVMITGNREDIAAVRYMRVDREASTDLLAKLDKALSRLGNGIDIPPEIMTGFADTNHWTAWQIDNSTFRHHLEPSIRIMVDSITQAFIRPALAAQGFPAEQLKRLRIWYDAGQITENPNRRQDALDAMDRILIGPKAGRSALGFNDADAPTPEEALQLIAAKNGIDQATAAAILAGYARQEGAAVPALPALPELSRAALPAARPAPAAEPDAGAPGGAGTPDTAPPGIAASASVLPLPNRLAADSQALGVAVHSFAAASPPPGYRIAVDSARSLAAADDAVREAILRDLDEALAQALNRAGSRLRSKATKEPALHASLRAFRVHDWPARIGRDESLRLGADVRFLIAGAWEAAQEKFTRRVRHGIGLITGQVRRMLGLEVGSVAGRAAEARLRADLESRIDPAWARLQHQLDQYLEKTLYEPDEAAGVDDPVGEGREFQVPPTLVRQALAEIGGLPETSGGVDNGRSVTGEPLPGLGSGTAVDGELRAHQAVHLGYQWRYGYHPRNTFEPHEALDGERFLSWTDEKLSTLDTTALWVGPFFHPGDHRGCLCSYMSVYALPEGGPVDIVAERLAMPPSASMSGLIQLAEQDDAAGRTGTTAQQQRDQYLAVRGLEQRFLEGA